MSRELLFSVTLKDCRVDTFRCPGKGGQNVNKRDTGVRVTHEPSGAVGQSCDERHQLRNKKTAFRRMAESPEFRAWVRSRSADSARVVAAVERELWPDRLQVEVLEDGEWVKK